MSTNQTKLVLQHLQTESITPMDALKLYGCFRLAARIFDLRRNGHEIITIDRESNGKHYAEYYLVKAAPRADATDANAE